MAGNVDMVYCDRRVHHLTSYLRPSVKNGLCTMLDLRVSWL